jgi:uroporphyrinogen-III decarboxylase
LRPANIRNINENLTINIIGGIMNNRQRIVSCIKGEKIDRLPYFFKFGPWGKTLERWHNEGLPRDREWTEVFGFDPGIAVLEVNLGYKPKFDYKLIEETELYLTFTDEMGITKKVKKNVSTIPNYLDYPVKDYNDWLELKKRLDPDIKERLPENWKEKTEEYNKSDCAIQIGSYPYGLFGTLRDMMGVESLLVNFYDKPELIHEIMDYLTDFWIAIYERVSRDVKIDIIHIWEDMSGKQGSLISPNMVCDFMMPNYKKIRDFAKRKDIPIISLDTDGNCMELTPLFIESGINLLMPFEVAAGSDINEYRRLFPNLGIMGGIDKREIAKGKDAIDRELERISPMFEHNGYFAMMDHLIHNAFGSRGH